MDSVAQWSAEDRETLFREAAERMGIGSAVITEKDFWVCWTLGHLFEIPDIPPLLFKGGTSLSKAFNLIERFSEDIDLSLDRSALGYTGEDDPLQIEGTNARRRKITELSERCRDVVREMLMPAIQARLTTVLGKRGWALELSDEDPTNVEIRFEYPSSLRAEDYGSVGYIKPSILLEIGARSDHEPAEVVSIQSYAAERFPDSFLKPEASVFALRPERTFWEKATIFHAQNNRPPQDTPPPAWGRLSRHAYDLFMMQRKGIADSALADTELLESVTRHKSVFYSSGWAKYDEAVPGTFRLAPTPTLETALRRDYDQMLPMFFGEIPSFDGILRCLRELEAQINANR